MPPSTDSSVVLVTGATGPAGHAAARRFAGEGARLALVSRDRARLEEMGRGLGIDADSWMAVTSDLSGSGAARAVVAEVEERWGRIDVLLHLIGGWAGGTAVVDLDHDEVRGMLEQHLWTTLCIVQQVVPGMVERHFGRVLAVSSPYATDVRPRGASYAVGKAAEEVIHPFARARGSRHRRDGQPGARADDRPRAHVGRGAGRDAGVPRLPRGRCDQRSADPARRRARLGIEKVEGDRDEEFRLRRLPMRVSRFD